MTNIVSLSHLVMIIITITTTIIIITSYQLIVSQ